MSFCPLCESDHEPGSSHVFAGGVSGGGGTVGEVIGCGVSGGAGGGEGAKAASNKPKRDREKYNAYMRDYMRKRRAK